MNDDRKAKTAEIGAVTDEDASTDPPHEKKTRQLKKKLVDRIGPRKTDTVKDLKGIVQTDRNVSIEDMNSYIDAGWSGENDK